MEPIPSLYEDIAYLYVRVIKQDSPEAGAVIEQINAAFGARAALRAALVITLLKMEVKENYYIPDLTIYGYIMENYPEAVPLLEQAIMYCCRAWSVANRRQLQLQAQEPPSTTSAVDSASSSADLSQ
jgi:hypothetical protein